MATSAAPAQAALPWPVVWALSVTQIVSWGSIYYSISVLLPEIETELGWSRDTIVGAYSLSLLCSGIGAYPVGAWIDRYGGRAVMSFGSVAGAALLLALSQVNSLWAFYLIWTGLGFTMAMVLYEPAFAVIAKCFGSEARKGITALTLAGGFASTVFWPLAQSLVVAIGWRHAVVVLALCNLLLCAPLHALFLPASAASANPGEHGAGPRASSSPGLRGVLATRAFWLLAVAFTANMLAFSALSVHLISLLNEKGFSMGEAVWLSALVGPMQVVGRIGEFTIGARFRVTQVAMFALLLLPIALVTLSFADSAWGPVLAFVVLYGASNGIMTIARGVIPVELFGRERYGAVNGALATPVVASRALGPFVVAVIWSASGGYDTVLWALAAIGVISIACFGIAVADQKRKR